MASYQRKAVALAFLCNFMLMGSYYILRPVRDTVATVVGVGQLQQLFTATFIGTFIASGIYTALATRVKLTRLLPGVFWFWLCNVVLFALLFSLAPENRWLGSAYYVWFSVTNLFMISVFWSLMVDVFSPEQATRLFALIAAGGALGAIAGPLLTRLLVGTLGLSGMLLLAAAGFALVIVTVHLLMREKVRLRANGDAQQSTLDHALKGNAFEGFGQLLKSRYVLNQAGFILLMTWVNTVAYFCQTDLIARTYTGITSRTQAIADIDLVVNICTACILLLGLGRIVQRFGVTAGLILNPLLMVIAFLATALSPTLFMIQVLQVVRRVAQYAIARPSREICFTVVEQSSRYKAKNVVDTIVYRFGDVSSAWVQAGLRSMGYGMNGAIAVGVAASVVWGAAALFLGRRYEKIRQQDGGARDLERSEAVAASL
ncbi:MAG: antiporter, family [Gammaproteobacteria bacterium]|nr:antiporter, family [Gammaproteobacteria bacterium]